MERFNFNDITLDHSLICRDKTEWVPIKIVKGEYIIAEVDSPFPDKTRTFYFKDYKQGYLDFTIGNPQQANFDIIKIYKRYFQRVSSPLYVNDTGDRWTPAKHVLPPKTDYYDIISLNRFDKPIPGRDFFTTKDDDWFDTDCGDWYNTKHVDYWRKEVKNGK